MKNLLHLFFTVSMLLGSSIASFAIAQEAPHSPNTPQTESSIEHSAHTHHQDDHHGHGPAIWAVIPFVVLLLMIATGPLFFAHFWHKYYPAVACLLGLLVIGYYVISLGDGDSVIHSLAEYIQFIALLTGLFVAAGGIMINVDKEGKPFTNLILLLIGAVLANAIGTTGASMLLIRPFIRLNKDRIKPYHIVFFIFMVSNVGGALTPIGDPPLFLGFLKGVPFEWTAVHNFVPWLFATTLLGIIFFVFDSRNKSDYDGKINEYTGKTTIIGAKNFLWIGLIIGAVFLDPNKISWVPSINMMLHGELVKVSFLREAIMFAVAGFSFYFADQRALKGNEFEFEPIKEVAYIFIGIFFTMIPALQLVAEFAKSPEGKEMITLNTLYWLTGALSGVLDNAPTYLNFLAAAVSSQGGEIGSPANVEAFSNGTLSTPETIISLAAISIASVFFGAMTYIGNAPNFMVKAIAEQSGIKMPAFVQYMVKYSIPILLPVLFLVWLVFIQFEVLDMMF